MKSTKTRVQQGGYLAIHRKDPEEVRLRRSGLYPGWESELGKEFFAALEEETSPGLAMDLHNTDGPKLH